MSVQGGTVVVRVEGRDVGLSDLIARLNNQMSQGAGTIRNYATAMNQLDPATRAAEGQLSRYAQSLASVAAKQGDIAGSQRILAGALQQLTPATTAANNVMLQLQDSINSQDSAAKRATTSWQSMAAGLGTVIGVYAVATRVVSGFAEVINQGNQLEKTLTTFKVLSGSQQAYQKNLSEARAQQDRFGGSLQDTIDGMSSFANLSNRTGIEIGKLTNLARAMAIIDPAQGFKGAGIALKEFFSGDITSLARRFEIPRDALNNIKNIADETQRFAALEATLAQFGISTELLAAQTNTTATAFEKLKGQASDATANIGTFLGAITRPFAEQITNQLDAMNQGFDRLFLLFNQGDQVADFQRRIFGAEASAGFDSYIAKINEVNAQLPIYAQKLQPLTEAQFNFAQGLIQTGVSADAAFAKVSEFSPLMERINTLFTDNYVLMANSVTAVDAFGEASIRAAASSAEGAIFAEQVAIAVAEQRISVEQGTIALGQFATAQEQAAVAAANAKAATDLTSSATAIFTQELVNNAAENINSQVQTDALKLRQEQLYAAALAAAQGMGATSQSAAALAGQFGLTTSAAYGLISALSQLELAKAQQTLGIDPTGANAREGRLGTDQDIIARAKDLELRKQIQAVQLANNRAAADNAGRVTIETNELSKLKKGTVEYEQQLGRLQAAERALAAEQEARAKKAGGSGGAPKLTPNEKINVGLLDQQDKFNDKFEDAEQKHWDKVAKIYEDFNKKQQEQFAKNEVSKRRSRADFYAGLQDAPEGVDTQQFAAQYEEAFAKAQEIAQTGKAKLANDFLELRQRQIEEMKQLDEEAAKIQQEQKEGNISEKDAQSQLAYLEGRKKLIEDAQREEQEQLLAAGDANQQRLQEQLSAEEEAYAASTDKIALQAERAADAKVTHAERSKIAVSAENKELANQAAYYERIARVNGGQVPASSRKAPIPTTDTTAADGSSADKPINVEASNPIPVESGDGLLVRQGDVFLVHDADVITTLGDVAARIEGKLGEVVSAVNNAKDSISSAVQSVESAVGRIKISQPSVVTG